MPKCHFPCVRKESATLTRGSSGALAVTGYVVPYSIEEHVHRFSAWAASRAASTKTCRFSVPQGKRIIEAVGLREYISDPDKLPSPLDMGEAHRNWRNLAIHAANARDLTGFTHGIAAKLINCYMKSALVCAGQHNHPRVAALHPPIDSLLLEALWSSNAGGLRARWAVARAVRWSKFGATDYESVIDAIKQLMRTEPLWHVEEWWPGHQ